MSWPRSRVVSVTAWVLSCLWWSTAATVCVSSPLPPSFSVQTQRGWVGNSIGPGLTDAVYGQVRSAPNNYAAAVIDAETGDLYTNTVWEESAKEMNRINASGHWMGRVEEAHGWSRTGGSALAVGRDYAFFSAVQGYIGPAYPPPQYPPQGVSWWGFFVVNKTTMMPVAVPGGVSFERFMLVTSLSGPASAAAMEPRTQRLTVIHPTDGSMQVWDTATMKQVSAVKAASNWTSLAYVRAAEGSRLWGVLDGQVHLVNPQTGRVMSSALPGIAEAMSVMASHHTAATLVVADGGLHTQQVLLFNVTDVAAPVLLDTIGEYGGVWGAAQPSGPPRGTRTPLRFEWLTTAGQTRDGTVMVVCASNTVWKGSQMMASVKGLQRTGSTWEVQWMMEGNSWVDSGSFDPESYGRYLFLPNCVYEMRLPLHADRPSGRCIASTTDLVKYPQDPRLHQDNFSFQCARVVYLASHRFLMLTSMYGGTIALYRYESNETFTAIPSSLLMLTGPYTDQHVGEHWPPYQPRTAFTWVDSNCDGKFDAAEFTSFTHSLVNSWSASIDSHGTLWVLHEHGIERTPLTGLDHCGNPLYLRYGTGAMNWTVPSEFSFIERIVYEPNTDVLLLSGWDPHSAPGHGSRWGDVGNLLVLYEGWMAGKRRVRVSAGLHSEWNTTLYPQGPVIKALAWAGELIFLVEGYSATVTVMETASLQNLTAVQFNPSPTVDWHNGWVDVPDGLQAVRLNATDFLVSMEDDYCAKTTLLSVHIEPDNSTLCARMALHLYGNATAAGEVSFLTLLVTTLWLGTPDTRHGANVYGLVNPLSPLIPLLHGDVNYRHDSSAAPNYLNDSAAQAALASKFVAFFGAALGCRAAGFPPYDSSVTLRWVHERMGIDQARMQYFNAQVTLSLQYWGLAVGGEEMEGVNGFLQSFGKGAGDNAICIAEDCEDVQVEEDRNRAAMME